MKPRTTRPPQHSTEPKLSILQRLRRRGEQKPKGKLAAKQEQFTSLRRQQRATARRRQFSTYLGQHRWSLGVVLGIFAAVASLVGIALLLAQAQTLVITSWKIIGNQQLPLAEIEQKLAEYKGRSLLLTDATLVEYDLLDTFPYLKEVYVRKLLPDTLEVELTERFPALVYIDMAGSFAIDNDNVVISVFAADEGLVPFSGDDLLILSGYGDPASKRVEDKYLTQIEDEEERKKVEWAKVPEEDKKEVLAQIREELKVRQETRWRKYADLVPKSLTAALPVAWASDVAIYKVGDKFDQTISNFTSRIVEYLSRHKIKIERIAWQTQFSISVETDKGTQILFSTAKTIDQQLKLLESVRQVENLNKVRLVDLRSELVSVKK